MRGRRWIGAWLLALCLALSATATAADEEFEGIARAFTLKASHGYELTVLAVSRHADGRGEILIFATGREGGASYFTDATVTEERIEAGLGSLGRIDVEYVSSGRTEVVRSSCGEDRATVEQAFFRGAIEFHGEEGYTNADVMGVAADDSILLDLLCASTTSEGSAPAYPVRG